MLRISVLGCNGLYPSNGINTSGYLVQDDSLNLVLDMGSGVFSALRALTKPENVDAVFISHLHFDHISDLGVYNYYLESLAKKGEFSGKIKVFIKKSESAVYQSIAGLSYFELCDFEENKRVTIEKTALNFFKTAHPVLTYGVTIKSGEKTLSYASDGAVSVNLENAIKNSDLTVCHAPFLLKESGVNKPHASAYEVCSLAKKYAKRVVISHHIPGADNQSLKREIAEFSGFYEFANQGDVYTV